MTQNRLASVKISSTPKGLTLCFAGPLDATSVAPLWLRVQHAAMNTSTALTIDLAQVPSCDTAGAAMLLQAERNHGGTAVFSGATSGVELVLNRIRPAAAVAPPRPLAQGPDWLAVMADAFRGLGDAVATLGQIAVTIARLPSRLRMFRWADFLGAADAAGVQAIPLVVLLGTLIGLILAFQSLVPMRRFGADIYVANLVAVGLIRELGPLLTAVILSGRSASAFAAEIGTMKVNQELDALTTMGVDNTTMLVLPRLFAAVLVMPVLTVLMELSGLLGMLLVLVGNGIPPVTVLHAVAHAVVPGDLFGGLFKSLLFGAAVAVIGCRSGLATGQGPRAVGQSATAAVVGGIVATVALDGLMAVLFNRLGI